MLQHSELDIMPDVAYSDSRASLFKFSRITILDSWSAVYAKADLTIRSEFDLNNKTVAVLKNSFQAEYLQQTLPHHGVNPHYIFVDSFEQGFLEVSLGNADCVVSNRFFGSMQNIDSDIYMTSMVFNPAEIRYAFSNHVAPNVIAVFDSHLKDLKTTKNSIYYSAYKKWLTPENRLRIHPGLKYGLIISLMIIVLLLLISLSFRTLLKRKTRDLVNQNKQYDYLAHHDPLTSLPNRLMFFNHLENAIKNARKNKQQFALVYIDLDQFKQINDTLGHSVGDNLLQSLALKLINLMKNVNDISRLGGDEFALIINPLTNDKMIIELINKIQKTINKPLTLGNQTFHLSSSIGVSIYPQDGEDSSILIRNADTAMYKAKESGRDAYQFYSTSMTENIIEHSKLLQDLRFAIEKINFICSINHNIIFKQID